MAEPNDTQDIYRTLDLSLRVGEVLLSAGAGAADVSATILSVARACGLRGAVADVTFTGLSLTHQPRFDAAPAILTRQVQYRVIDYEDLTLVDHLVHDLVLGQVGREEARNRLARIVSSGHRLPRWGVTLGYGAMGLGVGIVVGGSWGVGLIAAGASMGVDLIQRRMTVTRWPTFYQQVVGGFFATMIAVLTAAAGVGVSPSLVVTAGIILLLSGISFMGAVQDALTGFPLTAGARILEALLATAGVIAGVSGGLTVGRLLGVDLGRLDPGVTSLSDVPFTSLGAAIAAAAFALASYAPPRSLLPIAVVGAAAEAVLLVLVNSGLGVAWASALAAALVGTVSFAVAARVRVPSLVVVVPAVVPLLPGLSIYRGLSLLSEGQDGVLSIISAASVAIALSSGVIFGGYLAQPLRREARRLESRLSGPRLVGPLRSVTRHSRARARTARDFTDGRRARAGSEAAGPAAATPGSPARRPARWRS